MKSEDIRLEEFRQLRTHIRGSQKHLIVGIDIAKEKHNAFFGTAQGKTLFKRLIFENSKEGYEKLLLQTEAIKVQNQLREVVFGMEPTANYHKPLGEYLITNGHHVVLVAGNAVKRNRELLDGRWDKHDMKDSANVADLISQGKCQYYEYPCQEVRDLRRLLSLKKHLKKQEQRYALRIRNNLVALYFPEMDRYYDSHEAENLAIVKYCLPPSEIAGMQYNDFSARVTKRRKGLRQHKHLYRLWQLAGRSIGCEEGDAAPIEAAVMVEQLQQTRKVLEEVTQEIQNICNLFSEYEFLLSIPGFGPDVSSKVLAYIGDQYRFEKASQVLKMAGFDLSANRSGKTTNSAIPVISKKGKANLRYALYQSAMVASTKNRHFIKYFTEKIRGREGEKGIITKMRVKLAAKLLIIAWTLMKNKEPFNPDYVSVR
jgi:transposase